MVTFATDPLQWLQYIFSIFVHFQQQGYCSLPSAPAAAAAAVADC